MKTNIKEMTTIGIFAALIAICSWISIPFTIPFTLQTFAVFLSLKVLGGKNGTLSILVYILLGAIGLPVFAGFKGGIHNLFGATGGYIIGFLLMGIIYQITNSRFKNNNIVEISSLVIGLIICYMFGTAWFIKVYSSTNGSIELYKTLGWTVFPFIIPDLVKLSLAFLISKTIKKQIQ